MAGEGKPYQAKPSTAISRHRNNLNHLEDENPAEYIRLCWIWIWMAEGRGYIRITIGIALAHAMGGYFYFAQYVPAVSSQFE